MAEGENKTDRRSIKRTFKDISKEERDNILEEKDPVNTKKSTKLWMHCFEEHLQAKHLPAANDIDLVELPNILESFYSEVQKKPKGKENDDNEGYKNTTMQTIRTALARFYRKKKSVDIISNENFIRANAVFTGIQKINKKKGLGTVQ